MNEFPETCAAGEAMCLCDREPDHEGAHFCSCGGSWTVGEDGHMRPVTYPGGRTFAEAMTTMWDRFQ
jgi:hypothetical protein